jgi:membrane-bound inhibitor of C-type lysozyme
MSENKGRRPYGFDEALINNIISEVRNDTKNYLCSASQLERKLVEAGANAMLEALRKEGEKELGNTISGNRITVWVDKHKSGTWVFIPDDEPAKLDWEKY